MTGHSKVKRLRRKVTVNFKYRFQPFIGKSVLVILSVLEKWDYNFNP
jgi:hypothetical protein